MFGKIYIWAKNLASWLKIVLTISAFVTVVGSTLLVYKTKVLTKYKEELKQEQETKDLRETQEKLDTVIYSIGILSNEFNSFKDYVYPKLEETNEKIDYVIVFNKNFKKYMLENATTTEDILEILEIWDVKKNSENNIDKIASDR